MGSRLRADEGDNGFLVKHAPVWTPVNPAARRAADIVAFGKTDFKRPAQPEGLSPASVFLASPVCLCYITGIVLPVSDVVWS